jgi:glucokinase
LSPAAKPRGGVDLGGTKIQTVIVDGSNKVLGEQREPTPTEGGPEDVAATIVAAIKEGAEQAGIATSDLKGIGVGSPGDADEKTGVVTAAMNLPGWEGSFPLGEHLSKELGAPVKMGNDVQVAVDGEFQLGAGEEFKSVLGVWWGTGVGGGLILDGKPWIGRGAAAEIGHMVIKLGGAKCPCGRRGCMEAYAGRKAMEAKAREEADDGKKTKLFELMDKHDRDRLTSGIWERAYEHDDKLAKHLIDRAIEALAAGIGSACNLIDPEAVILGGGMGDRFGKTHGDELRKLMLTHLFVSDDPPEFRLTKLGDLGGAIGAALLVKG